MTCIPVTFQGTQGYTEPVVNEWVRTPGLVRGGGTVSHPTMGSPCRVGGSEAVSGAVGPGRASIDQFLHAEASSPVQHQS